MSISGRTKICGLIGDPVHHSLSPFFQNAAFKKLGLDYIYVVFKVEKERLQDAILGMRGLGIHGLNVTMPHKINIIPYLDELNETSKSINSANTVLNKDGKLIGYTTDGVGALNALRHNGENPDNKKIIVLGAGGTARSVSVSLAREAMGLVILNRTLEKAKSLAEDLVGLPGTKAEVTAGILNDASLEEELETADILINATSVGMKPQISSTPVNAKLLHSGLVVFDLVYDPVETRLLRDAMERGARTIGGLAMLVLQGAASFEIWTGEKAPYEAMVEAAREALKRGRL